MLEIKVLITPFFITRVDVITKGRTSVARDPMPVHAVGVISVVGREVKTAAKPPDRIGTLFLGNEKTHVGMRGGYKGIFRMHHQRHAHGLKMTASQLGAVRRRGGRHTVAKYVGKAHTAFFQQAAVFDNTRPTTPTTRPLPAVFNETRLTIGRLQCAADSVLQVHQIVFDRSHIGGGRKIMFHRDSLLLACGRACSGRPNDFFSTQITNDTGIALRTQRARHDSVQLIMKILLNPQP